MNEKITLHTQSIDQIINMLREQAVETGNPTLDTVAGTIEAQRNSVVVEQPDGPKAVGFAGLPGSGKSLAAELFESIIEGEAISMGDAIRAEFEKQYQRDYESEELANFAANSRMEDAAQIPEWVTDLCDASDATLFAIDGVRSVTDYEVLDEYFDEFELVFIQADFYTRLDRVTDRGREGEGDFEAHDLVDRDQHEFDKLGLRDLLNQSDDWAEEYLPDPEYGQYDYGLLDYTIHNNSSQTAFRQSLLKLAEEIDWLHGPSEESVIGDVEPRPPA